MAKSRSVVSVSMTPGLEAAIRKEATVRNTKISTVVVELLMRHFAAKMKNKKGKKNAKATW